MPSPGACFSTTAKRSMRRGDQCGLLRRDQAAQDRPAGLHQFRRHHDIDVARRRHQRENRIDAIASAAPSRYNRSSRRCVARRRARRSIAPPSPQPRPARRSSRRARRRPARPWRGPPAKCACVRPTSAGERASSLNAASPAKRTRPRLRRRLQPSGSPNRGHASSQRSNLVGLMHDLGAVERGAQRGRLGHFAAIAAADAGTRRSPRPDRPLTDRRFV